MSSSPARERDHARLEAGRGARIGPQQPGGRRDDARAGGRAGAACSAAARRSAASGWRGRPRKGGGPGAGRAAPRPATRPPRPACAGPPPARSTSRSRGTTTRSGRARRASSGQRARRAGPARPGSCGTPPVPRAPGAPRASGGPRRTERPRPGRRRRHGSADRARAMSGRRAARHERRRAPRARRRASTSLAADDLVQRPVRALHQHVRAAAPSITRQRRVLVVDHDAVDRLERRERLRALGLGDERAGPRPLSRAHGGVGVDADHEDVALARAPPRAGPRARRAAGRSSRS